jgi:hypothetical protein
MDSDVGTLGKQCLADIMSLDVLGLILIKKTSTAITLCKKNNDEILLQQLLDAWEKKANFFELHDCADMWSMMLASMKKGVKDIGEAKKSAAASTRVATIDYGFKYGERLPLHSKFDLGRFIVREDKLFEWYTGTVCDDFVAPYFPLIQSSGTGKTRLLFEYSEYVKVLTKEDPTNCTSCLLLTCSVEKSSIHGLLAVAKLVNDNEHLETVDVVNGALEITRETVIEKTSPVVVQSNHSAYVDGEGFTKVLKRKSREQPGKERLREITNFEKKRKVPVSNSLIRNYPV